MLGSQSLTLQAAAPGHRVAVCLFLWVKVSVPLYWQIDTHMNDESLREGQDPSTRAKTDPPAFNTAVYHAVSGSFAFVMLMRDFFARLEASEAGTCRSHDASQGLLPLARPGGPLRPSIRRAGLGDVKVPSRILNAVKFGVKSFGFKFQETCLYSSRQLHRLRCTCPLTLTGIVAQQRDGFPTDVQKVEHD